MNTPPADFSRLVLLIQRILDADVLCETVGNRLLTETEAARHSQERGDTTAARQHVEQVMHFIKSLVRHNTLAPSDGHTVLEAARRLLNENFDQGK